MKRNYQTELEQQIEKLQSERRVPRLLLHSCCAPCSSYVLEYLSNYFEITVFYYNPNIFPEEEYGKRVEEQARFVRTFPGRYPIHFLQGAYDRPLFYESVRGLESVPEGGARCFRCYRLRLEETARQAKEGDFDFFTTTLTISPLKNAQKLNEIGEEVGKEYGIAFLNSDFKKKDGYKRSTELSRQYGMYRQDYCGCEFSLREREARKKVEGKCR
jgi:epoxyqueuosine reductase